MAHMISAEEREGHATIFRFLVVTMAALEVGP